MLTSLFRGGRATRIVSSTAAARRKRSLRSLPSLEAMERRQLLSTMTFNVTTNEDNGDNYAPLAGSLRSAIIQADGVAPGNTAEIDFHLPTDRPLALAPDSTLPAITGPTFLNATTQSGYSGSPLVQLDGSEAGGGAVGLQFLGAGASNGQVKGLQVINWNGGGILADGATGVVVANDWVGVSTLGNGEGTQIVPSGNGTFGVEFADGANAGQVTNSVVSGNQYNGVVITSGSDAVFVGNSMIGTDPTGEHSTTVSGNSFGNGIVGGGGSGVVVNGGSTFAQLSADVISNNHDQGVLVTDAGTDGTTIRSSEIGTDLSGNIPMPNHYGLTITNGAGYTTVGSQGAGNLISGNAWDGLQILNGAAHNTVAYNKIGTNSVGGYQIPNVGSGVALAGGASNNTVTGNLISGNSYDGVYIAGQGTSGNVFAADLIGTDVTGEKSVPNHDGVQIQAGASGNTFGGITDATRDVISGNAWNGVELFSGASGNVFEGDYIGTDAMGVVSVANGASGVAIFGGATDNTVGGASSYYRNVISGNSSDGVWISDPGTNSNTVQYNFIGTDVTGEFPVSNRVNGLAVGNGASYNNVINDLISANLRDGVLVTDPGTVYNSVNYDWIGLDATGNHAVKQLGEASSNTNGVQFTNGTYSNSASSDVISGNLEGVFLNGAATGNWINNDYIGTNISGNAPVGNTDAGIFLLGVVGNDFENDVVAFNAGNGLFGEGGSTPLNNNLCITFFVTTSDGVAHHNGQNDLDFDK